MSRFDTAAETLTLSKMVPILYGLHALCVNLRLMGARLQKGAIYSLLLDHFLEICAVTPVIAV
jgi:hypothetical protein